MRWLGAAFDVLVLALMGAALVLLADLLAGVWW